MPAAIQYNLDPDSREARTIDDLHVRDVRDRAKRFDRNWRYYKAQMLPQLKKQKDGVNDNVILPLVGNLVDKIVAFLIGDNVEFHASQEADAPEAGATAGEAGTAGNGLVGTDQGRQDADHDIEDLWKANRKQLFLQKLAMSGSITGHCAVRVEPGGEGKAPRFISINPAHFAAFWSVDDIERVLWYRLQYQAGDMGKRIDYVRGAIDGTSVNHDAPGWLEIVYGMQHAVQSPFGSNTWQLKKVTTLDGQDAPVVDWQNRPLPHDYYGQDDVEAAIQLNDSLNRVISVVNRILKHHADPKTIMLGATAEEVIATEIGGLLAINKPPTEAKIYNLEMESDLSASLTFAALLERILWQTSKMVDPQSLKDRIGALTNFGLRVLYKDATDSISIKRLLYGEGLEIITQRGLALMGKPVPADIDVEFPDPLPIDTYLETTAAIAKVEASLIDKTTAREELGYDAGKIEQRLADEKANSPDIGTAIMRRWEQGQVGVGAGTSVTPSGGGNVGG